MGLFNLKKKVTEASTQQESAVPQMPKQPAAGVAPPQHEASSKPFSLPDLPPMPQQSATTPVNNTQSDDSFSHNLEQTKVPVSPALSGSAYNHSSDMLPELPELPSFDNHPENDFDDALPQDGEMEKMLDKVEKKPSVAQPVEKKPEQVSTQEHPKNKLPSISAPRKQTDGSKPLFVDVARYADIVSDLNVARDDLKHIHDRSVLSEHEDKIDEKILNFKDMIMKTKNELNKVDQLLFAR